MKQYRICPKCGNIDKFMSEEQYGSIHCCHKCNNTYFGNKITLDDNAIISF